MIALGIFILGVLLVTIPVPSRPLKAIMFTSEPETPVPLPAHSVRRNNDLSSDPISECLNHLRNGLSAYAMFQLFSIQAHNTVDSTGIAGGTLLVDSVGDGCGTKLFRWLISHWATHTT
ncbi:hypothetical protein MYU51_001377 [Penicillium brevicompactum]